MPRRLVLSMALAMLCAGCAGDRDGSIQGEGTRSSDQGGGDPDHDAGAPAGRCDLRH